VQQVRKIAVKAGFGHECDVAELAPGSRKAAYYVSKYVGKSTDVRAEVPWARWQRFTPAQQAAAVGSTHRPGSIGWDARQHSIDAALDALGEAVGAVLGRDLGATALEDVPDPLWDPDGGYFVELLDLDGDDYRAWTPVRCSDRATYRTWSMSRTWGLKMSEVKAEAAAYARLKAGAAESAGDPTVCGPDLAPDWWLELPPDSGT
jgi:hypothetical protein